MEDSLVGVSIKPGLQFRVGDSSQQHLDLRAEPRIAVHRASGLSCPLSLLEGAILLQQIDATRQSLHCTYREGPGLAFRPDAHVKYLFLIVKESGSARAVLQDLAASAVSALPIAAAKSAPLAPGRAPLPQEARFWSLRDGSVQGVWLAKSGAWMARLQVDYPDTPANESEARAVAEVLFGSLATPSGRKR